MKFPNFPQININVSTQVNASTSENLKKSVNEVQSDPNLDKYKGMESAPSIPYHDPFNGRNATNIQIPHFFGMRHYRIMPSAIDMSDPHKERTYQYGDLTDVDEINAFLDQLDRLDGDHRVMFEHLKPSKELLSLAEKLSDEELEQFTEFMVEISRPSFIANSRNTDLPDRLISTLNSFSDDTISSSVKAMTAVLDQGKAYKASTSPISDNEYSSEQLSFVSYKEGLDLRAGYLVENAGNEFAKDFATLLNSKKLSEEQLVDVNRHIGMSSFEQSRGILDMAATVSKQYLDDVITLLAEVDKSDQANVFAYLGQQVNYQAHRQYYQLENGDMVIQQDDITGKSKRRNLYENVLTAHKDNGLKWVNDAIKEFEGTPAQIQNEAWQKLLDDKAADPDSFLEPEPLQAWAIRNLGGIEKGLLEEQTVKIMKFNSERLLPDLIVGLKFITSGNQQRKE